MVPRVTVAALLVMALTACGSTGHVVRLDTGDGAPLEYRPPAASDPVKVDEAEFRDAMARLLLDMPLTLRSPQRGWLVPAAYHPGESRVRPMWLMTKSYFGRCKVGERGLACLSVLDAAGLDEWDKLGVALGFSLEPMKASIARTVEKTLLPELVYGVLATGIITWAVMAANPEPVFTKFAAVASGVMLAYLGIEIFLELVEASWELKRATDAATTVDQLEQAGRRYAERVGPVAGRVFVLAITVGVTNTMVVGASSLASRLARLPGPPAELSAAGLRAGITWSGLGDVAAVSVVGKTVVVSLPTSAIAAVAMSAQGSTAGEGGGLRTRDSPRGVLFLNQKPDVLELELEEARRLGVKPVNPSHPDFARYANAYRIKWVVTEDGELLTIPHQWGGKEIMHTAASGGRPVLAAGEANISVVGSTRVGTEITPHSGHYLKDASQAVNDHVLEVGRRAFARFGITFPP